MHRLSNSIRPYLWGSKTAIPYLLGTPVTGEPQAEMWLGTHPAAPSRTEAGQSLSVVISTNPEGELGTKAFETLGPELPFLMKVLAAAQPLSLQVHPNVEQAREGFDAEEAQGIPRDAPERNYRDRNHKPEMIVALGPFDALCGFRAPEASRSALRAILGSPVAGSFYERLDAALGNDDSGVALHDAMSLLLGGSSEVTEFIDELTQAVHAVTTGLAFDGTDADTVRMAAEFYPGDPGIAAAILLNRVHLDTGEALFLDAGIVHAYLMGLGIEVMACSDNVLRGGLTPKHIDVAELERVVRFEVTEPMLIHPISSSWPGVRSTLYVPPVKEFVVDHVELQPGAGFPFLEDVPKIALCVAGAAWLQSDDTEPVELHRGNSVFVGADDRGARVRAGASGAELFIAECVIP